jgi:hypothetical protein
VVEELDRLEVQLGGRDAIVGMLSLAPLTPDLKYLLGMLGDPVHRGHPLADICAMGGILPGDLLHQLAQAALLKGKVLAGQAVASGIQAVAADVMRRSAPYQDACHQCLGIGTITPEPTRDVPNPSPGPCETCRGTGQLTYKPDLERQKLAIEMAQLLPKSGGIQIAQINGAGGSGQGIRGAGASHAEILQKLTDKLLYDRGPRAVGSTPLDVEAEVVAELPAAPSDPSSNV